MGKDKKLRTHLMKLCPSDMLIIYRERGDYAYPEPTETINSLGRQLCQIIKNTDKRFSNLEIPIFSGALSPITEFLDSVTLIAPNYRIIFILDEFDELPIELYKHGSIGDAFFGTLRSISGKPPFSFILVGGETMEHIINYQGHALNRFRSIHLDYIENRSDFYELVRNPVKKWLEISDDALLALYEQTAGNPFFAKLICGRLFKMMVDKHDSHVTSFEIKEATKQTVAKDLAANKVQHFWIDGIFETDYYYEEITLNRKKFLYV
jgi:hypothetical protein